jgi:hypothetical protein
LQKQEQSEMPKSAKKPETVEVDAETLDKLKALAARYAVADPGKDARDDFFRRVASL